MRVTLFFFVLILSMSAACSRAEPTCLDAALQTWDKPGTGTEKLEKAIEQPVGSDTWLRFYRVPDLAIRDNKEDVTYRYFIAIREQADRCEVVGDFHALEGVGAPFSGGVFVNHLPVLHDVVTPGLNSTHFVYVDGYYRDIAGFTETQLREVVEKIFSSPHQMKFLLGEPDNRDIYKYD